MRFLRRKNQWSMEIKHPKYTLFFFPLVFIILYLSFSFKQAESNFCTPKIADDWEKQLNSLNYLVMKSSSINLIHGLYLSDDQINKLIPLAKQVEALNIDIPDKTYYYSRELNNIGETYQKLISDLLQNSVVNESLKNEVYRARELESDIIKRSLLGTQLPGYKADGCLKCHATPDKFPTGSIAGKDTKPISSSDRKEIDLAHVKGFYGEEGTQLLWNLRDNVDEILTNEQKYIFKSFRCSLVPQEDVSNPGIFGQSFVTNEWIDYFRKARYLSDQEWQDYKNLFIIPLDDIIVSTLPGVKKKDKMKRIHDAELVLADSRKMDAIDFELQKENLCVRLSKALNIDLLNGEAFRSDDDRKFMAAMFLLFPESNSIYEQQIKNKK